MKKNFLIKIIISIIILTHSNSLKIPFKTFSKSDSENYLSNNFYANIYSAFQIGSQSQSLPCSIILQRSEFYVNNENFNPNQSKTFVQISNSSLQSNSYKFVLSKDDFQLNSKTIIQQINFDLIVEVTGARFNPKQCQIGFQINDFDDDKNIFIKILKEKNVINSYVFFLQFNNVNEGNLFLGNLPEEIMNFDRENFRTTKVINQNNFLFWGIQFDDISINKEKIKDSKTVFFSYEFGLISATKISEEIIAKNLFNLNDNNNNNNNNNNNKNNNNKNCFMEEFTINEELFGEVKYNSYYCDLSAKISNFPLLEFYNKDLNYTFKFDHNDLFVKNNNRFQFLIIFEQYEKNNRWKFGRIFFKKFLMVFDYDKKQIGFYVKEGKNKIKNNDNKFLIIFLIILILILILIGYKFFIRKNQRKIKANELEDNFEYKSEKENYSKLIN